MVCCDLTCTFKLASSQHGVAHRTKDKPVGHRKQRKQLESVESVGW